MSYLAYCTIEDIKDEIINFDFSSNTKLTEQRLGRMRAKVDGEINAALTTGGYTIDRSPSTTTATSGAEVASTDTEVIAVTSATGFAAGNTVRIYGLSTNTFNDTFSKIVSISSNNITVFALGLAFDSGATFDLITAGEEFLRDLESKGVAIRAAMSVDVRSGRNEKITELKEWYDAQLESLKNGELKLDGLSQGEIFIESIQTEDSDKDNIIFTIDGDIF